MTAILKALQMAGLAALLGGAAFHLLVWSPSLHLAGAPVVAADIDRRLWRRIRLMLVTGALAAAGAALADLVEVARTVSGGDVTPELLWALWFQTRYGRLVLLRVVMVAILAVLALKRPALRSPPGVASMALAIGLALDVSLTGHAGARAGVLPVVADAAHVVAASAWAGGLAGLVALPWSHLRGLGPTGSRLLEDVLGRFSTLGLACVAILAATGAYAGFLNVYGLPGLTHTPYGRLLAVKLAAFAGALALAALHRFALRGATARRAGPSAVPGWAVGSLAAEVAAVGAAVVLAAVMSTQPPPEWPVGPAEPVREAARLGPLDAELRIFAGPGGVTRFELRLTNGHQPVDGARVVASLAMPGHFMIPHRLLLRPAGPGSYVGETVLTMPGLWEGRLTVGGVSGGGLEWPLTFPATLMEAW